MPEKSKRPLAYWVGENGKATEFWSRICLLPMVTRQEVTMMNLHSHWENGNFAFPGALLEQPQVYLEAMDLISIARANLKKD